MGGVSMIGGAGWKNKVGGGDKNLGVVEPEVVHTVGL